MAMAAAKMVSSCVSLARASGIRPGLGSSCRDHRLLRAYSTLSDLNVLEGTAGEMRRLTIDAYDQTGFTVSGVDVSSSVILVGNLAMQWDVRTLAGLNRESLAIFELLSPPPELVIMGTGKRLQRLSPEITDFFRSRGMKLEAIATRNAASTFNILSEEGRNVAAALLLQSAE